MNALKMKTVLNSLVCSRAHAEWNNGTHVTEQLRNNDLRFFVGISSKRKEQLIYFWETRKSCVMAATELLNHFLANISWDYTVTCIHRGSRTHDPPTHAD